MYKLQWMWLVIVSLVAVLGKNLVTSEEKVYGGRIAKPGEFPFAVYVKYRVKPGSARACGGTLATLSRVITAGHCFLDQNTKAKNDPAKYVIYGGAVNVEVKSPELQTRQVKSYRMHEKMVQKNSGLYAHDIGVIELNEPFSKSKTLSVMKVPSLNEAQFKSAWEQWVKSGRPCMGIGWGATETNTKSADLKTVELMPWTDDQCRTQNDRDDPDMIGQGEICLSQIRRGESLCGGDSGGPVICGGNVFGVLKGSYSCGTDESQFYLLLWPYLKYFQLASDTSSPPVAKPPHSSPPVAKPPSNPPVAKPPSNPPVAKPPHSSSPVAKPPNANPPPYKPPISNFPTENPPISFSPNLSPPKARTPVPESIIPDIPLSNSTTSISTISYGFSPPLLVLTAAIVTSLE